MREIYSSNDCGMDLIADHLDDNVKWIKAQKVKEVIGL